MSKLADFIDAHLEAILDNWERFAATLPPFNSGASAEILRDHAAAMLGAISQDLRRTQSSAQQRAKSEGLSDDSAGGSAAGRHGADRHGSGLDVAQMVSEFRALRATVIRLWSEADEHRGPNAFDELLRFNEAIDQAVAESITSFGSQVDHFRHLMLGMIAHDLRGPLNVISLSAGMLARTDDPRARELPLARLQRATGRAQALVNDVLDVAGTHLGGHLPVAPEAMDLAALAHDVIEEARGEHPQAEFVLECHSHISGQWDRGRLAQLLHNLLHNAVEHGSRDRPVRCTLVDRGDAVVIEVQNHGPVIPREQQARIFDAGVRSDASADPRTHLGLGLFICREIAEAHGGNISVRSNPIEGTVFAVLLPRQAKQLKQDSEGKARAAERWSLRGRERMCGSWDVRGRVGAATPRLRPRPIRTRVWRAGAGLLSQAVRLADRWMQ